jgi:hypothetical protein
VEPDSGLRPHETAEDDEEVDDEVERMILSPTWTTLARIITTTPRGNCWMQRE